MAKTEVELAEYRSKRAAKKRERRAADPAVRQREAEARKRYRESENGKQVKLQLEKKYRQKEANKEKHKAYLKEYYSRDENRIARNERAKAYRQNNPQYRERCNRKRAQAIRQKCQSDPAFRAEQSLRGRLRIAVRKAATWKHTTFRPLLGCTYTELREHLSSQFRDGMSWDNYGKNGWEIDHIVPCSAFDLSDPEQQKKCFHYTNLQPLWLSENRSKCDRLPTGQRARDACLQTL